MNTSFRISKPLLLALATALLIPQHGHAAPQVLVETGSQVPGQVAGVVFASFTAPVTNRRGDVAFRATMSGPGIDTTNDEGIFLVRRGVFPAAGSIVRGEVSLPVEVIVLEDVFGLSGINLTLDPIPFLTDLPNSTVLALGRLNGPGITTANDGILLRARPSTVPVIIAQEGELIASSGYRLGPNALDVLASLRSFPIASADYNGNGKIDTIGFSRPLTVVPDAGGFAIKGVVTLVEEVLGLGPKVGDPMIGNSGVNFGSIGDAFNVGFVDGNSAIFLGGSPLGDLQGIYAYSNTGVTTPLLLEGKPAPGLRGFTLGRLESPVGVGNGSFVFPGFASKRRGDRVTELAGVFDFYPDFGKLKLTLPTGASLIPGGPMGGRYGATFRTLADDYRNRVIHTEVTNVEPVGEALVASFNGKRTGAFAFEGGPAPGFSDGSTIAEILNAFIDGGSVGWAAERIGVSAPTQTALFQTSLFTPPPLTSMLIVEGQPFDFNPGGTRTATSITTPLNLASIPNVARYFTSTGTAYLCNFAGGGSGICFSPRPDEQPVVIQPDIIIESGDVVVGDNIHEPKKPKEQRRTVSVAAGTTSSFIIRLQNDSSGPFIIQLDLKAPTIGGTSAIRLFLNGETTLTEINSTLQGRVARFEYDSVQLQPGDFVDLSVDVIIPAGFDKFQSGDNRGKIKLEAVIESGGVKSADTFDLTLIVPP